MKDVHQIYPEMFRSISKCTCDKGIIAGLIREGAAENQHTKLGEAEAEAEASLAGDQERCGSIRLGA